MARPSRVPAPKRSRTMTVVSAGLVLVLLLAAINAAILLSASAPRAAEARQAVAHQMVTRPAPAMPALAGRAHNATLIVAWRERVADAAGHRPLIFALLLLQALVMGGTTFYLWKKAGQVLVPAGTPGKRRRPVNPSADGYARG